MTSIRVDCDDITSLDVDAMVAAANTRLAGGGDFDGAVPHAAGPRLLEACRSIAFPAISCGVHGFPVEDLAGAAAGAGGLGCHRSSTILAYRLTCLRQGS